MKLASEIARTGSYSSHDAGAGGSRGPSAYFPPAYPYSLAVVDLLDGHRAARAAATPARLSQALLGTVTVALIGLVALELAAVWAALRARRAGGAGASCAFGALLTRLRRSPVGGRLDAAPPRDAEVVEVGERLP